MRAVTMILSVGQTALAGLLLLFRDDWKGFAWWALCAVMCALAAIYNAICDQTDLLDDEEYDE